MAAMPRRKAKNRRRPPPAEDPLPELDPYLKWWMSLTPAQRLRRSWPLRRWIKGLEAIHDAKLPRI